MRRIASVALVLAVLAAAELAEAAVTPLWPELGGSASDTGVSQTPGPAAVFEGSVAVGGDGWPVVVYTAYPDATSIQGAIIVKRWTGSAWEILGEPTGIGQGYEPQVQISGTMIHVAWLSVDADGNSEVRLRAWNGSAFVELGGSDSPGGVSGTNAGIVAPISLALDAAGNPIVAFLGLAETGIAAVTAVPAIVASTRQVYVRRWTGTAWEFLGGGFAGDDGFSGGGASKAASFTSGLDRIVHDVDSPSLAVNSHGEPVVAFSYITRIDGVPAANTDVYVTRWSGSAWVAVGPAVPAGDGAIGRGGAGGISASLGGSLNPSLTADATGKLALAWEEEAPGGEAYIWVRTWNGTAWVQLAGSAAGSGLTQAGTFNRRPRVAIDATGRAIVTWAALTAIENPSQIFVRRWNGSTAWEELGFGSARGAGISDAALDAFAPALALTPPGGPAIAWLDLQETGSFQVFLRQLVSGTSFPLTIRVSGAGTLTSDPIGVECSTALCVASFPSGTSVTLLPQAGPGSTFTGWSDGCTGSGPCTVAMTTARSVNASFVGLHALRLTVATPAGTAGQGTVGTITGPAGTCLLGGGSACASDVLHGTPVVLRAAPQPGNRFLNWTGGPCNGRTNATCDFVVNANVSTTALFRAVTGVAVVKAGNGAGTVSGPGITCGADCFQEVFTGTSVTLTAAPATGSSFLGWTGDVCNGQVASACVVTTADQLNRSVTATFRLKKQRLAVTTTGAGFTRSTPAGIDCGAGAHTKCGSDYDYGTVVSLTAFPDVDSMLSAWTGCTSLNGSVCAVIMTANRAVTGRFSAARTLSVTASGNGSGRITTATPPGLACVSNCSTSQLFPVGASVVLTPQPAVGTSFRWTGGVCSGTAACTTLMSANRSAIGQFTLNRHALTVADRATGNVRNDPAGSLLNCGSLGNACTRTFDYGTAITLTATANPGFVFVNWTGTACTGSTSTSCPIILKANVSVAPNFRARTVMTVVKAGNGAGTVSGAGISCGADCSESVFDARTVTLTATPAVGSRFAGFTGACASATSPCTFTPQGDSQSVTATFELIPFTVSVTGRDNGRVVDDPALGLPDHVNCGAGGTDCRTTLNFGTSVVLQATPIPGSRFVNWAGGVCAGSTNSTCRFRIPAANISVSPGFRDVTAVSLAKIGQGTVVSTPAGISCGLACAGASFDFARGLLVRLTATPAVGWNFNGFSGACSGLTCAFNASAPTALVGANFSIQHRRLTIIVVGQGTVGGGAACGPASTCVRDLDYGTSLTLAATAAPGHRFTGWSQNCLGTGSCAALMTINRSVTATFKPVFALTVTKPGNSPTQGLITASPAGISCGADCSEIYLGGTLVTLTRAAPVTGTTFRWGGACAFRGTNASCALTLGANTSVTADYSLQRLGLEVFKSGATLGTVRGAGINCGADCLEVVNYGTLVTLTAVPNTSPAAEFVSWSGCTPAANVSCSFTMTANKTVTATFQPLVTGVTLKAISTSTLAVGGARQISAIAAFTDGRTQDVTTMAVWRSSNTSVATVSATGVVTGRAAGTTNVTGTFSKTYGSFTGAMTISVDTFAVIAPAPVVLVSCTPYGATSPVAGQLACLPSGVSFSVVCQATGLFASTGSQDITDQVTWLSSAPTVALATGLIELPNDTIRQSFRIVGNGTAILRAVESGKTSSTTGVLGPDPWVVQGAASTVTGITVTPSVGSVAVRGTLQLRALATVTSNSCTVPTPTRDFSRVVTWSSSDEDIADVSFTGEVSGVARGGPVTITASYPRVMTTPLTDTATVTVP